MYYLDKYYSTYTLTLDHHKACPTNTTLRKYDVDFHGDICKKNNVMKGELPWTCPEECKETAKEPFCEMPWPRLTFYTDDKHKHYPCRVDSGKLNTNS